MSNAGAEPDAGWGSGAPWATTYAALMPAHSQLDLRSKVTR